MALLEIKPHAKFDKPMRFEMALAEISTLFINLPAERIDSEIEAVQFRVCELLDIDRSTLWQVIEEEPGMLKLASLYQTPESLPPDERMNAKDFFPWSEQKVLSGETVAISKLTDLPPEAEIDLENYRLYGTKSNVLVPLSVGGGPVFGVLTFAVIREEREWTERVVQQFKLLAQVFANALARKQMEEQLKRRLLEIENLKQRLE